MYITNNKKVISKSVCLQHLNFTAGKENREALVRDGQQNDAAIKITGWTRKPDAKWKVSKKGKSNQEL